MLYELNAKNTHGENGQELMFQDNNISTIASNAGRQESSIVMSIIVHVILRNL